MVNKFKSIIFRIYINLLLVCLISYGITGCNEPEEFSNTPQINFNNVEFRKPVDSIPEIILSIDFTDGDGNLGFFTTNTADGLTGDVLFPYHDIEVISGSDGRFITFRSDNTSFPWVKNFPNINYAEEFSSQDNRPDFDCINYQIGYLNPEKDIFLPEESFLLLKSGSDQFKFYTTLANNIFIDTTTLEMDTVFIRKNENHFNILVDFFIKKNGSYEYFEWLTAFDDSGCNGTDFRGRFPVFDYDNLDSRSSIEGTLKYSMKSNGFDILFRNDTIKLRIKIKDLALNESNVIETPDFTLQGIARD
jgi:hypothetical protein